MTEYCLSCLEALPPQHKQLHPKCYKKLFGATKVSLQLPYSRAEIIEEVRQRAARMSLGGAQPKASLGIEKGHLTMLAQGGTFLLKPSTEKHPFISENEHFCMNVASRADLTVPPFCLVQLKDGEHAFLIKRFDRSSAEKIHIEDFASVLDLPADDKYKSTYLDVGAKIDHFVRDKGFEKLLFLKQIMLSYLIGNNDLHIKNFSIIDRGDHYELSPAYDILCSARYYHDEDMALPLAEDFYGHLETLGSYTSKDFVELGKRLGLEEKPLEKIVAGLLALRPQILELLERSFLPGQEKKLIFEIIQEQYKKFEG